MIRKAFIAALPKAAMPVSMSIVDDAECPPVPIGEGGYDSKRS